MDWGHLFRMSKPDEATPLGEATETAPPTAGAGPVGAPRAVSICVASGKGGTGKSVLTASLASLMSARGRTLIVDGDLGVGDAHILQDISPTHTLVDLVEEGLPIQDVLMPCGAQVDLLAGGSGVSHMAGLTSYELRMLASGLEEVERDYRFLLVDSAAGVSGQTLGFAAASDVILLVTTPCLTAMTDAYAFLKALLARRPDSPVLLLVNRATSELEAQRVAERLGNVSGRFLGVRPRPIGWLPEDPAVTRAANHRQPVVVDEPDAEVSKAMRRFAVNLLEEVSSVHARGLGRWLLRGQEPPAARA
jgi:flagellar biosynthesis protein FlhG